MKLDVLKASNTLNLENPFDMSLSWISCQRQQKLQNMEHMENDSHDLLDCLADYEMNFHEEVADWVLHKTSDHLSLDTGMDSLSILDISVDHCIFGRLLADKFETKNLVAAVRDNEPLAWNEIEACGIRMHKMKMNGSQLDTSVYDTIGSIGQFDIIVLKDILHEIKDLSKFLRSLGSLFKSQNSKIFIISRPKHPPLPLPPAATSIWDASLPSRQAIISAAEDAGYWGDIYCASCPIKIEKNDWVKILKTRCLPALTSNKECTDKAIDEYFDDKKIEELRFEEKFLMFRLWKQNSE